MKRTLIVTGNNLLLRDIKNLLPAGEYQVIASIDTGMEALRLYHRLEPDLVVMGWQIKGFVAANFLENLLTQNLCPVLVILTQDEQHYISDISKYGAHHVLMHPFSALEMDIAVNFAQRAFTTERRHMEEIRKLEDELKTRKLVYQAILRIIHEKHMDEPKAYEQLRLQAMKTRKTIRSTAQSVIKGDWIPE